MIATRRIVAIGGAGALLAIALGMIVHGTGTEGWSAATRWTARWSVIPFALAFAASGLLPRVRGRFRDLLRNRRGLGLSFALAHGIHAICIVTYFTVSGDPVPLVAVVGGGIGYALILAMALTSTDAAQRALGRNWKRLHTLGIHWVWFVFFVSYLGRTMEPGKMAEGYVGTTVALLALGLRMAARFRRRAEPLAA